MPFYHIICFKFKPELPQEQRDELKVRFMAMKTESKKDGEPYILNIRGGDQTSKETMAQGMDLAFVLEFASTEDRHYYHKQDSYHRTLIPQCIEYTAGALSVDCEDE